MGVGCGLPAWIGEAEQREGGSPARRRRRCKQGVKVSTWKGRRKEGKCGFWLKQFQIFGFRGNIYLPAPSPLPKATFPLFPPSFPS